MGGQDHGRPIAPPALAQDLPKGGVFKIAMRVPKIDSPHTYSWIYDSNIMRAGVRVHDPHGGGQRHPSASGEKVGTLGGPQDLDPQLRDVKWHSGRPLTAEDLAWNIKHCLDPATGSSVVGVMKSFMLKEVDTGKKDDQGNPVMTTELWDANAIEVKDDRTLVLNLKEAQVAIPEHLFHYAFGIVDPAEGGKFGVGSNGTEGFELAGVEVGRKAILKARKDYAAPTWTNSTTSTSAIIRGGRGGHVLQAGAWHL